MCKKEKLILLILIIIFPTLIRGQFDEDYPYQEEPPLPFAGREIEVKYDPIDQTVPYNLFLRVTAASNVLSVHMAPPVHDECNEYYGDSVEFPAISKERYSITENKPNIILNIYNATPACYKLCMPEYRICSRWYSVGNDHFDNQKRLEMFVVNVTATKKDTRAILTALIIYKLGFSYEWMRDGRTLVIDEIKYSVAAHPFVEDPFGGVLCSLSLGIRDLNEADYGEYSLKAHIYCPVCGVTVFRDYFLPFSLPKECNLDEPVPKGFKLLETRYVEIGYCMKASFLPLVLCDQPGDRVHFLEGPNPSEYCFNIIVPAIKPSDFREEHTCAVSVNDKVSCKLTKLIIFKPPIPDGYVFGVGDIEGVDDKVIFKADVYSKGNVITDWSFSDGRKVENTSSYIIYGRNLGIDPDSGLKHQQFFMEDKTKDQNTSTLLVIMDANSANRVRLVYNAISLLHTCELTQAELKNTTFPTDDSVYLSYCFSASAKPELTCSREHSKNPRADFNLVKGTESEWQQCIELELTKLRRGDFGTYSCNVMIHSESCNKEMNFTFDLPAPPGYAVFSKSYDRLKVSNTTDGDALSTIVYVSLNSTEPPSVTWQVNGTDLENGTDHNFVVVEDGIDSVYHLKRYKISLVEPNLDHNALYTMNVTIPSSSVNLIDSFDTSKYFIKAPCYLEDAVVKPVGDQSVKLMEMELCVDSSNRPSFRCFFKGIDIYFTRVFVQRNNCAYMTIRNARREVFGNYECVVHIDDGAECKLNKSFNFTLPAPKDFVQIVDTDSVDKVLEAPEAQNLSVNVISSIDSDPPKIRWTVDGMPIENSTEHPITFVTIDDPATHIRRYQIMLNEPTIDENKEFNVVVELENKTIEKAFHIFYFKEEPCEIGAFIPTPEEQIPTKVKVTFCYNSSLTPSSVYCDHEGISLQYIRTEYYTKRSGSGNANEYCTYIIVEDLIKEDFGDYACVVWINDFKKCNFAKQYKFQLPVPKGFMTWADTGEPIQVMFAEGILRADVLVSTEEGLSPPKPTWFREDTELNTPEYDITVEPGDVDSALNMRRYKIEFREKGSFQNKNYSVTVLQSESGIRLQAGRDMLKYAQEHGGSFVTSLTKNVTNVDNKHKTLVLTCLYSGNPEPRISWFKGIEMKILSEDPAADIAIVKSRLSEFEYKSEYIMKKFLYHIDQDIYGCRIENLIASDSKTVNVIPPTCRRWVLEFYNDVITIVEDGIHLDIDLMAHPAPKHDWYKPDGRVIFDTDTMFVNEIVPYENTTYIYHLSLILKDPHEENAGVYTVTSLNDVGTYSVGQLSEVSFPFNVTKEMIDEYRDKYGIDFGGPVLNRNISDDEIHYRPCLIFPENIFYSAINKPDLLKCAIIECEESQLTLLNKRKIEVIYNDFRSYISEKYKLRAVLRLVWHWTLEREALSLVHTCPEDYLNDFNFSRAIIPYRDIEGLGNGFTCEANVAALTQRRLYQSQEDLVESLPDLLKEKPNVMRDFDEKGRFVRSSALFFGCALTVENRSSIFQVYLGCIFCTLESTLNTNYERCPKYSFKIRDHKRPNLCKAKFVSLFLCEPDDPCQPGARASRSWLIPKRGVIEKFTVVNTTRGPFIVENVTVDEDDFVRQEFRVDANGTGYINDSVERPAGWFTSYPPLPEVAQKFNRRDRRNLNMSLATVSKGKLNATPTEVPTEASVSRLQPARINYYRTNCCSYTFAFIFSMCGVLTYLTYVVYRYLQFGLVDGAVGQLAESTFTKLKKRRLKDKIKKAAKKGGKKAKKGKTKKDKPKKAGKKGAPKKEGKKKKAKKEGKKASKKGDKKKSPKKSKKAKR